MTTSNPNPAGTEGTEPATAGTAPTGAPTPAADVTAATQLAAVTAKLEAMCTALAAELPDHLRALVPAGLPPADRLEWLTTAKKAGLFGTTTTVPPTDGSKPPITPKDPDFSKLPAVARMALGYSSMK